MSAAYTTPQELEEITLSIDELEAVRLVDAQGIAREDAAAIMSVSQPTLCRILASARKSIASALTEGKALRIEGGHYDYKRFYERV